ncbi:MAG: aminopeptidase [Treponema sp.]|jgi:predicted aminopeptidase|nr:aminopeptidase [Treponema sp.]
MVKKKWPRCVQDIQFVSPASLFPPAAAAILLLAASASFSGCYTLKQGTTMLGYLNRAIPLERLAGDSASAEDRRFVRQVEDIRRFAMRELGLKESKNYTRYVKLDRSWLAAVVSASAKDSFTRHEWRFPVVGAVPYKGFFSVEDARKERAKLEKKDLDVWIRGVDAFSTLGWFRDPLYSYMRDYSPDRLADLIIHELTHATVFIKGQVQFNEELAEFVGSEGARLYMESRFGADSEEYRAISGDEADNRAYVAFVRELAAELDALYQSGAAREEKLLEKERIIKNAQARFEAEYESRFHSENYRGFAELHVNNAYLELYRLYYAEDNYFADLYERTGRNLPKFITAAAALNKSGAARKEPRAEMERALDLFDN